MKRKNIRDKEKISEKTLPKGRHFFRASVTQPRVILSNIRIFSGYFCITPTSSTHQLNQGQLHAFAYLLHQILLRNIIVEIVNNLN